MRILVLYGKHGERFIHLPDLREWEVVIEVIKERHKNGLYEGSLVGDDEELLKKALGGNQNAAKKFFRNRQGAEYERWAFVELEEILND